MSQPSGIFADSSGQRWGRFRRYTLIALLLILGLTLAFVQSLLIPPGLPTQNESLGPAAQLRALLARQVTEKPDTTTLPPAWLVQESAGQPQPTPSTTIIPSVRAAFYVNWDPNSLLSLREHGHLLTHVIPEWFQLGEMPPRLIPHTDDPGLMSEVDRHGLKVIPLLNNLLINEWQPEPVESLLRGSPEEQAQFGAELAARLVDAGCAGVLIDWQQVDPTYRDAFTRFMAQLAGRLHAKGLELWIAVPMGPDIKLLDLHALAASADRLLAMLHDENGEEDSPGPVASQPWFTEWLEVLLKYHRPEKWVMGIGNYGYDWPASERAEAVGFLDVMTRARSQEAGQVGAEAPLYSPHFSYSEGGVAHELWFLDAITFRNQAQLARERGSGGIALYRLGSEDPGVWPVIAGTPTPAALEPLPTSDRVAHVGQGDFLRVESRQGDGQRSVTVDGSGLWSGRYAKFPGFTTLFHSGEGLAGQVALTFDDGPDPDWTPQILDILKEQGVKASFFVVGVQAESYPDLVRRMLDEGHEVGVHTYFHPDISTISSNRLVLEMNATQHLLEGLLQRSTLLFRPPYNVDSRPGLAKEVEPVRRVQKLGYITVAESIDTQDWDQPGVAAILERVKSQRGGGNTVLMHDAGGDRSQTVEALPLIIDWLQARGDEIVSLATLANIPPRTLMPPLEKGEDELIARTGFDLLRFLERFFWSFMILATLLVLLRTLLVLWLALRHQRRSRVKPVPLPAETPAISVLIAAFNEEKVIGATLRSVLASHHAGELEVVVVDDGSQDRTAAEVEAIAALDPHVRLIRQPNQGKALALRLALANARHQVLVMLDADTQFEPETIPELLRYLALPGVGAVSGHVKVGNPRTWLGRFQSLEYTCGFNLDRRAYDELDCITVVPGAACALRREALEQAGGISDDTLAEDTDLTLTLKRLGWTVRYNPQAVAWTEAPETVAALAKQRVRWSFGTLQCLWKHRALLFNPRFGWLAFFSLPSIALFQMFLVAMIPLVDALLVVSLVWGFGLSIVHYVLLFLLVDLALALLATLMEREPPARALYILPMRLLYRPLLAYAVWRSLLRALRGSWSGWSKLERRGNVRIARDPGR